VQSSKRFMSRWVAEKQILSSRGGEVRGTEFQYARVEGGDGRWAGKAHLETAREDEVAVVRGS